MIIRILITTIFNIRYIILPSQCDNFLYRQFLPSMFSWVNIFLYKYRIPNIVLIFDFDLFIFECPNYSAVSFSKKVKSIFIIHNFYIFSCLTFCNFEHLADIRLITTLILSLYLNPIPAPCGINFLLLLNYKSRLIFNPKLLYSSINFLIIFAILN